MMENGKEISERKDTQKDQEEIFSKAVRAGKRTYFFDVKSTKAGDFYMTITESKKRINPDGHSFYEKHKMFLYKEDFDKFTEGLKEMVDYIKSNNLLNISDSDSQNYKSEEYSQVNFEDLDK